MWSDVCQKCMILVQRLRSGFGCVPSCVSDVSMFELCVLGLGRGLLCVGCEQV